MVPSDRRFHAEKLYPFSSHFITVGRAVRAEGFQLHYIDEGGDDAGTKPVVLCLHGNPTWGFYFRNLILELRKEFRVIVPDYIGCGLSDHPPDYHFRAADRIAHLEELVAGLNLKRFSLVMHDWGGPIGTGLAVRMIPAIDRLVYFNTTLTETESLPKIIQRAASPLIGKFLTKHTMRFLKLMTGFGVVRSLPREVKEGYYHPYRTSARRTAIWDFVQDIPFNDNHPSYHNMLEMAAKLPELRHVPVKIIWGLRDPCFHLEMLNRLALHFPQADILEIPQAAHLVLEDAPELAITEVKKFLTAPREELIFRPHRFSHRESQEAASQRGAEGLYGAFQRAAEEVPRVAAVTKASYLPMSDTPRYEPVHFDALAKLVTKYERGLTAYGLSPYDRVIMMVPPGVDFLALSYAIMGRGAVPVFIDPGIGVEAILKCCNDVEASGFIGVPRAHLLRLKDRALFRKMKFRIVATSMMVTGTTTLWDLRRFSTVPPTPVLRSGDDAALIAFTSGATGVPKGVVFTNKMLDAQLEIFRSQFGFSAGALDLPLLPIFSLFTAALGVGSVFAPVDPRKPLALEPDRITRVIQELSIESSFGSPTLWAKIGEYCLRTRTTLPSLKRIFMAGAAVPRTTIELAHTAAPHAEVYTPYGATEALPVTLARGRELIQLTPVRALTGEQGTPVGKPVAGVEVRIIHSPDESVREVARTAPCAAREIGEIIVSGPNVSASYLHRPEATLKSKLIDGHRLWHRIGDMGYLDEAGELYYCGRVSHVVREGARVYHSVPVEQVFQQHQRVRRAALITVRAHAAVAIEPHPHEWPATESERVRFAEELRELGRRDPVTSALASFYFHQSFPVDARHNAKIFRDKLGQWAESQRATQAPSELQNAPSAQGVV